MFRHIQTTEDYLIHTYAPTAKGCDESLLGLLVGLRGCWTPSSFQNILFSQKFYFLAYETVDVVQNFNKPMGKQEFWKTKKQMIWPDYEIQTVFFFVLYDVISSDWL